MLWFAADNKISYTLFATFSKDYFTIDRVKETVLNQRHYAFRELARNIRSFSCWNIQLLATAEE